jgi:hypothetical protein
MRWTFAGILSILLLLSFVTSFPSLDHRQQAARLWAAVRRTRVINKQDARVWIVKRSGFYYCSDSRVYGTLRPGAYMRQDEALQRGYQPFSQSVCR